MATKQEVATKEYNTGLNTYLKAYVPMIQKQIAEDGETFDDYSRYCVVTAMGEIISMVHNSGAEPSTINPNNLNDILLSVARLKLNANAVPRECYFQIRNVNAAGKGQPAKWEKQVEFNIEGDGYDALTARYGRNVKKVYPYWAVREGDTFVPPKHRGLEVIPPEWEESGEGKVVKVVYPIEYTDGHIEYHVAERAAGDDELAVRVTEVETRHAFARLCLEELVLERERTLLRLRTAVFDDSVLKDNLLGVIAADDAAPVAREPVRLRGFLNGECHGIGFSAKYIEVSENHNFRLNLGVRGDNCRALLHIEAFALRYEIVVSEYHGSVLRPYGDAIGSRAAVVVTSIVISVTRTIASSSYCLGFA